MFDKVVHHEEVVGETLALDDGKLLLEALENRRRDPGIALFEVFVAEIVQPFEAVFAELREDGLPEGEIKLALPGDEHGVAKCV